MHFFMAGRRVLAGTGKEISYNNLLDIDAAVALIADFDETTVAILKHNNACGLASRPKLSEAWKDALDGDPVSAFGGIIITNTAVDAAAAAEMDKIFFEVVLAPAYDAAALEILKKKKNRIILILKQQAQPALQSRTLLNGVLIQERDTKTETADDLKSTQTAPRHRKSKICCLPTKSEDSKIQRQSTGQKQATHRRGDKHPVDALKHAISKAGSFDLT